MDESSAVESVETASDQSLDTTAPADGQVADQSVDGQDGGNNAENEQTNDVPESYEFAMPEGVTLDENLAALANPKFQELGLSQEQAQGVADLFAQYRLQEFGNFNQQIGDWQNQSRNDPDFGGAQFDQNISVAKQGFDQLFSDDIKGLLLASGFDNHPSFIKAMLKVGKPMQEDSPGNGQAPSQVKSRIEKLYGS